MTTKRTTTEAQVAAKAIRVLESLEPLTVGADHVERQLSFRLADYMLENDGQYPPDFTHWALEAINAHRLRNVESAARSGAGAILRGHVVGDAAHLDAPDSGPGDAT